MHPGAESLLQHHIAENPAAQEEWRQFCKLKRDPRIISGIGQLLRRTSVDELPQLWNVLRGDMSLVGPRPLPMYHVSQFSSQFRRERCNHLPGITGMWQIMARSDGDLLVQQRLDTYYFRNWSFWLDLYVLARTIPVVISGKGAY
jgi:lipopolysaccharide/colanic/teichoic acid biosynthesis glycosyltransferase